MWSRRPVFALSQGNVSGHLSKLEDAAYVEIKKGYICKRPQTIISLTKKGRELFKKYIKNMRELFDDLDE